MEITVIREMYIVRVMRKYVLPKSKFELIQTEIKKYDESNTGIIYAREAKLIFKKLGVPIAVSKDKLISSEILQLYEQYHVFVIKKAKDQKRREMLAVFQILASLGKQSQKLDVIEFEHLQNGFRMVGERVNEMDIREMAKGGPIDYVAFEKIMQMTVIAAYPGNMAN